MINERDEFETQVNVEFGQDEMSGERAENVKATTKRFFSDLMNQKWKIIIVFICLAFSAVCSVLSPKVLGIAIDQIYSGIKAAASQGTHFFVNLHSMGGIILILLALYLLGTLLNYIPQRILASVSQEITFSLRKRISEKLNRLPLQYFDTHKKGDILSRVTSDLEKVSDTLQEGLAQMITSFITLVGAFVMLISISIELTVIALGTVTVSILVAALVGLKTNRYYAKNQTALGALNANIEEAFTGNKIVKSFNLQDNMIALNDKYNENLKKTSTKAQFITYAINALVRFMGHIGYVVIAVRGAMSVISGNISIGDVQAVFQYVNQISEPITQLSYIWNNLQGALASAERIYQLLDEPEEAPDITKDVCCRSRKVKLPLSIFVLDILTIKS